MQRARRGIFLRRALFFCLFFVKTARSPPVVSGDRDPQSGGRVMTNEQKEKITFMRQAGCGYLKIAKAIGVSENTVKSYCRRQKVINVTEESDFCAQCGKPIDKSKRSGRRFCSDVCRIKWWNKHPKAEMRYTAHCACCGKEIQMRRKNERKYCSHRCYITARYMDGGGNG